MEEKVVKTKALCKSYFGDGEGNHVIKNIDLNIYKEDFAVIMGSSGSGKSTLLYLLSGLETITSGEVEVLGSDVGKLKGKTLASFRREKIGFIYQGINLVQSLSLIENVVLPGYLIGKNKKAADLRAKELLTAMGLENHLKKSPSKVSGGQQQRVAIARALINNPEIIFADEPTGALNSKSGQEVLDLLTDLNNKGKTVIMVTHDIKAALRANRILFIKDGRIDGELKLQKYNDESKEYREKEILSYLKGMGW